MGRMIFSGQAILFREVPVLQVSAQSRDSSAGADDQTRLPHAPSIGGAPKAVTLARTRSRALSAAASSRGCSRPVSFTNLTAGICVLPYGVTTAPNAYSGTIAVSNPGAGDTFALVTGSLPPGLTMPAQSGFLISGTCVLPDAVLGQPYQGHLVTSHKAGGKLSIVASALPPA
jgi:hypothetical protein